MRCYPSTDGTYMYTYAYGYLYTIFSPSTSWAWGEQYSYTNICTYTSSYITVHSQTQPYLSPTWHLPLKWTLKILDISPPLFLDLNRQINTSNHRSVIQLVGNYQNVENILLFYLFWYLQKWHTYRILKPHENFSTMPLFSDT